MTSTANFIVFRRISSFERKLKSAASIIALAASLGTAHAASYEYNNPSPFNPAAPSQPNLAQINVTKTLHDTLKAYMAGSIYDSKVIVAILDGKADINHVDLQGHATTLIVYKGRYTRNDNHGTHVSGIVGAAQNNIGMVGVAPFATLLNIPVFDQRGWVATDLGLKALNAAQAAGARVVNMSYGPTTKGDVFLNGELNIFKNYNSTMVLVRAAGNDGVNVLNESFSGNASVDLSNLLIVGSVNGSNTISSFSNRPGNACIGNCVTYPASAMKNFFIVAPGENILSDLPQNYIGLMSGTSMAAPHVAGAAALVYQYALAGNTQLSPGQVAGILKCSATDLGAPGIDAVYGAGLLNVAAALQPCGGVSYATGGTVDSVAPLAGTRIRTSSLVGARSVENALSGMIVLDDYKRAFVVETPKLSASFASVFSTNFVQELSGQVGSVTTELSRDGQNVVALTSYGDFAHGGFKVISVDRDNLHFDTGFGASSSYFTSIDTTASGAKSFSRSMAETFFTGSGDAAISLNRAMFFGADLKTTSRLTLSGLYLRTTPSSFDQVPDNVAAMMWNKQLTSSLLKLGANYQLFDGVSAGVSYGLLQEQGQLLGMQTGGAFSMGDGVTQIGGANVSADISATTSLSVFAEQSSTTSPADRDNIFSVADTWSGSKYGMSLAQSGMFGLKGVFRLTLVRPWQVDRGALRVHLPVGRELDGTVDYNDRIVSIATEHTPWEMRLAYLRGGDALTYGAELRMLDRTIMDKSVPEVSLAAALRWSF